jgi:transposase
MDEKTKEETVNNDRVRYSITDKIWEKMEPELEKVKCSKAGRPAKQKNRDFMEAVIWIVRTGAPWRDLPRTLGKWHTIYTRYRRWGAAGVWTRMWEELHKQQLDNAFMCFFDSTTIRAHQHAAGAPGKTAEESALGRSKGGLTTKIHVATVDEKIAISIVLTPGNSNDCTQFQSVYENIPEENTIQAAALDKGYDSNQIRLTLAADGIEAVIPGRSNRVTTIVYDKNKYKKRNCIERFFNRLKHFRRVATRYEKHAFTFLSIVHIAAAFIAARN